MEDKIENKLLKDIKNGCGRTGLFTLEGEDFFRICNSPLKYDFEGNLIEDNFCSPRFCATCKMDRLPKLKARLQQHRETKKYFLELIDELLPKYYEDGADEFAGQLKFVLSGEVAQ